MPARFERALPEWKSLGRADLEYWGSYQTRQAIDSPRYTCALHDPHGGHLHPLNYTLGLADAAERTGAVFYEKTPVVSGMAIIRLLFPYRDRCGPAS